MAPPKTRTHDRHHIPAPAITPDGAPLLADKVFLDGAKERIHELFLTAAGLPGHVVQVQQEFNRLDNSNLQADRKRMIGKQMLAQITKAAEFAAHDIPETIFILRNGQREYHVSKAGAVVKAYDTVYVPVE
jgi:hypothetical protein